MKFRLFVAHKLGDYYSHLSQEEFAISYASGDGNTPISIDRVFKNGKTKEVKRVFSPVIGIDAGGTGLILHVKGFVYKKNELFEGVFWQFASEDRVKQIVSDEQVRYEEYKHKKNSGHKPTKFVKVKW